MLKRSWVVLAALFLTLLTRGTPSCAQEQGQDALALLVKSTGYQFAQIQDKDIYLFLFSAKDAKGVDSWLVRVSYNNERKGWIVVSCTVIDEEDSTSFPSALKDELLQYNSRVPGSKFAWDQKHGDIDVEWEVPTQLLTGSLLAYMINDVASTCDDQYNKLAALVKAGKSQ